MSFNPNHNSLAPITLGNYEEYFVLYADKELSDEERLSVEQFLETHPHLQQELDLFVVARLPLEQINLEDKESLLAHSMKLNTIDEKLLLYIDDECTIEEKNTIEERLKTDKAFQLQYQGLLQTKLSNEQIVYPYKKELYHHEIKARPSFYWMRIAAAVIVLLGTGLFVFTYKQKPGTSIAGEIEQTPPAKKNPATKPTTKPASTEVTIVVKKPAPVEPTVVKVGEPDDATNVVRNLKKNANQNKIDKQTVLKPVEVPQQITASNDVNRNEQKNNLPVSKEDIFLVDKERNASQQSLNNNVVTPPAIASFNNQTTSAVTAETKDVVITGNEKKSSLKGFLRKATRFIERRANISTTNENDELLIGFVALKL